MTVLVSNSVLIAVFTLLPLNLGRLVLVCDGMIGSRLLRNASDNGTMLVVGYATIVVAFMSYVLATMYQCNKKKEPLLPIIKQLMSLLKYVHVVSTQCCMPCVVTHQAVWRFSCT